MPNVASPPSVGIALAASLIAAASLGAQAPADTLPGQAPPADSVGGPSPPGDDRQHAAPPPEYDPGADRHFLLPSGRVAPHGTGSAGAGGLASPALAAPFVSASPLPRVSIGAATMLVMGLEWPTPVVGSVTVQPLRDGRWDGSATAIGYGSLGGPDFGLAAILGSLSYGTDAYRVTAATGSLGPTDSGWGFAALGFDIEVYRGEGATEIIAGEPRTVRERVKLVGELYTPLESSFEGVVGLLGARFSGPKHWVNVGLPVALGTSGGAVWIPIATFGVAF
jgi:hypothetical protein